MGPKKTTETSERLAALFDNNEIAYVELPETFDQLRTLLRASATDLIPCLLLDEGIYIFYNSNSSDGLNELAASKLVVTQKSIGQFSSTVNVSYIGPVVVVGGKYTQEIGSDLDRQVTDVFNLEPLPVEKFESLLVNS